MRNARFIVIVLVWAILPTACATGPNGGAYQAYAKGDYRTALAELLPLAEQGDDEAQLYLAYLYQDGKGVPQDQGEALRWFRRSAEQGNIQAQDRLGRLYADRFSVIHDDVQALVWLNFAAAQGSVEAASAREDLVVRMTPVEIAEAQRLGREFRPEAEHRKVLAALRPQAEQGKAEAQRQLASMYYKGQGVSRDYDQACAWYRKAADQGDALAQSNLGYLYAMGQGVRQDYREAAAWYWRAAIQGDAVAQYRLGVLFEKGQGVAQSEVQALTYYILAAARAYPQAVVDRDRLTSSLAAAQINEAQRLAREFRASGP